MKNLKYIDALRGLAVLAVMIVHCSKFGQNNYPFMIQNVMENGAMGVQLFYIVSAFTLFLSADNRRGNEQYPRLNFFIRRFFRIAPLYYLAVGYYLWQDGFGARYWLGDMTHITTGNIVSNFFFCHGLNPYWINSIVPGGWSISVEMFFYCMIPFLATRIKNLNQAINFFSLTLLIKILLDLVFAEFRPIGDAALWNSFLYFYLPSQLPAFACGIITYFVLNRKEDERLDPKVLGIAVGMLVLQLGIAVNYIHIVFALVYILLCLVFSKVEIPLFNNRFTRYMGKISFSVYLLHFAVLHWMGTWGLLDILSSASVTMSTLNYVLRFGILAVLTISVASLSFYLLEKPLQQVGKALIRSIANRSLKQA